MSRRNYRRNYNSGWYGCSGNFSRSRGAEIAESNGLLPLTRAIPEVARKAGITQKKAREILREIGPDEWHHTGKYYQRTWYYSVEGAVEFWHEKETERAKA